MTNGEMMQKVFPEMEVERGDLYIYAWIEHEPAHYEISWWDAEYDDPIGKDINVPGTDCISRDDAIEVLKDWDGYFIGHSSDDVVKALNLAIKALEHPEKNVVAVVPCGDAISREEVLTLMKENWHTHNGDWAMQESMDDIRALPSVTPQEPRKGHWIGIDEEPHEVWECDHCGFVIDGSGCIDPYDYRDTYKFCPNCGAKMEVEDADSN